MNNEKNIKILSESIISKLKEDDELLELQDVYGVCISIADTDTVFYYQSLEMNEKTIASYLESKREPNELEYFSSTKWTGFKYSVGDWYITDYELDDEETEEFFDDISDNNEGDVSFLLVDIVADAINLIKDKLDFINKTEDFVIFVVREGEWDEAAILKNMSKTIAPELFNSKL